MFIDVHGMILAYLATVCKAKVLSWRTQSRRLTSPARLVMLRWQRALCLIEAVLCRWVSISPEGCVWRTPERAHILFMRLGHITHLGVACIHDTQLISIEYWVNVSQTMIAFRGRHVRHLANFDHRECSNSRSHWNSGFWICQWPSK